MRVALVFFGVLAALFAGVAALFTVGETAAILVVVLLLGVVVAGFFVDGGVLSGLLALVVVTLVGSAVFVGNGVAQLVSAFTTTEGPVDPADPIALAAADAKVDGVRDAVAFRLELTEDEMTAYVLDGLQGVDDNPLQSVSLDVIDGSGGEPGRLDFAAEFKGGGIGAQGSVTVRLEQGTVQVDLADISAGAFDLPGVAQGALEDLVERVADFNETLEGFDVDIQSVELGQDRLVITGTQLSTDLITSRTLLAGLSDAAQAAVDAVPPPPERFGPGVVDATAAAGSPVYVALGDSLAANVGVDAARDGYVSRFHHQLQLQDGLEYGLRNFAVSGETTGTLIRSGQLDAATEFMRSSDVAYVTIDIGANNLLGHLGSEACSVDLDDPDCRERLDATFAAYPTHLRQIFEEIEAAAPDATVVFLTAYNPFSLGLGTAFEEGSDQILADFNGLAVAVAEEMEVLVADGFTPMQRTAGATSHMLDAPPDIHPLAIGFDILTGALLEALA